MYTSHKGALPLTLLLLGVLSWPQEVAATNRTDSDAPRASVVFLVADPQGRPLADVQVLFVGKEGEEAVGKTDQLGSLEVPLERLTEDTPTAVLFCKEWYFCGALRTSTDRFLEYREHYIKLLGVAFR